LRHAVTFLVGLLVIQGFHKFRFQNVFAEKMERCCYTNKKYKFYIKCNDIPEIFGGNVVHNHDADSEACLNRQILINSVKRKAMENLCEIQRKLIHKELRSQYLDTFTYKDISNISRTIHIARSSQMLRLLTDKEKKDEALFAVQVLRSSTEFLANDSEKSILMFSCKNNSQFFSSICWFLR